MTRVRLIRSWWATVLSMILLAGPLAAGAHATVPSKQRWERDVAAAMSGSLHYLDQRVARGGRHLAINLDIDNTSLATYYDRGAAVVPVLRFARHARSLGVTVLFNTGRLARNLAPAKRMLTAAGYRYAEVCGRRDGERLAHSKQRCRAHFVREGYRLIANVGNNRTDFVGGNYERAYRLPNYGGQLS